MIHKLDDINLKTGSDYLANTDETMAMVLEKYGYPPLWSRDPGFSTMVHIILEQQVSLSSANAAFQRLKTILGTVMPDNFLELTDEELRSVGYSRQKIVYTRHLAQEIISGNFSFGALEKMHDNAVKTELCKLKGIGDWTAEVYLSEALLRPDILPKGDIAILEAIKVLKKLEKRPTHEHLLALTEHWKPWRSVGTRLLWHYYLGERGRKMPF